MSPTFNPKAADSAARARPAGPQPITTKSNMSFPIDIGGSCNDNKRGLSHTKNLNDSKFFGYK